MLTEKQIRCLFTKLNNEYFDGVLIQPTKIEFKYVKGYLGQFHWHKRYTDRDSKCVIRFSTAWEMTDEEVEQVLIHEMVHEWQWIFCGKTDHGRSFKAKAYEINKKTNNKYKIARCTSIQNKVCLKDRKKKDFNGIAIIYKKSGYPGKILVAKTTLAGAKRIAKWFPNRPGISDVKFYNANGAIYNKWRASVKIVHGYTFDSVAYMLDIAGTLGKEIKF